MPGVAYAVFYDGVLVEFHNEDPENAATCLGELRNLRPFQTAFCKSFDQPLLDASQKLGGVPTPFACLFRRRSPVDRPMPKGFHLSKAAPNELDTACHLGRGFFDSRQEAAELLQTGGLWMARHDHDLIGCGISNPLDGPHNAVDIGMVVDEPHRGQGFGTAIIRALADAAEHRGQTPVCGCSRSNIASKTALERAGFVSEHALLRIDFPS